MFRVWRSSVCLLLVGVAFASECDRSKCRGPLRFYEQLGCEPIYANPGDDCCAVAYDCSDYVAEKRPTNRCYFGHREYADGDLVLTHSSPESCSYSRCLPSLLRNEGLTFYFGGFESCTDKNDKVPPNCYRNFAHDKCCGEVKCLDRLEDRYKCEVDGETYLDGEEFKPKADPTLKCYCMEGYKGENIEPFCKNDVCDYEVDQSSQTYIRRNCPPYYSADSSLADDCPIHLLCEYGGDVKIIEKHSSSDNEPDSKNKFDNLVCNFNNRTMHVGDTLYYTRSRDTLYEEFTKCVCEVPPVPSCRRIPREDPVSNNV